MNNYCFFVELYGTEYVSLTLFIWFINEAFGVGFDHFYDYQNGIAQRHGSWVNLGVDLIKLRVQDLLYVKLI